jgi:type IV secretion system protein VirB9
VKQIWLPLSALLITVAAQAAQTPSPGPVDPRIRTILYNPREVVTLTGQIGYQMVVQFGSDERIENISIGDAQSWQVTPNRKADLLFLKPIDRHPSTNMTVVTNLRRYNFELVSVDGTLHRPQTYDVRFLYPEAPAVVPTVTPVTASEISPDNWNFAYSFTGARGNVPARVFDDGRFTYFQWVEGVDSPAVFVIGSDGKEALVNPLAKGHYFVVETVAAQFVLRNGSAVTQVFNDALKHPEPGAGAPREREAPAKRGLFSRKTGPG